MTGFGIDTSRNYLVWGNVQPIQYVSVAKSGNTTTQIAIAKRRAPGFKELAPSGGVYTAQDVVWLIPATLMSVAGVTPKPGDLVAANGASWTILECPLNALGSTYRCITRDMVLAFQLDDSLSVRRPIGNTTDAAGGRTYSYETVYDGIACRFQEVEGLAEDERGQRLTARRFNVWVESRLYLTIEDQVQDEAGNIYEVKGWRDADRIDQLQQLDCELRWAANSNGA